jgi:hypothetical protein
MTFGPWQPDISETERRLRCRELCVIAALLLGHDHSLPTTLRHAETDPEALAAAKLILDTLPPILLRSVPAAYANVAVWP